MGLLNKITNFARSPEGRRTISGLTNRGTSGTAGGMGGTTGGTTGGAAGRGTGGMLRKVAGGLLGGRRR